MNLDSVQADLEIEANNAKREQPLPYIANPILFFFRGQPFQACRRALRHQKQNGFCSGSVFCYVITHFFLCPKGI